MSNTYNNIFNDSNNDSWWKHITDCLYRIKYYYYEITYSIKKWYQKMTKGYADVECWNLPRHLSLWILPRLKHLRNNTNSTPSNLECGFESESHSVESIEKEKLNSDESNNQISGFLTLEEWREKLDKMIYAFEFILKEDDIVHECYPKDYKWGWTTKDSDKDGYKEMVFNDDRIPDFSYHKECLKKYQEGMKLFQLYFKDMWD